MNVPLLSLLLALATCTFAQAQDTGIVPRMRTINALLDEVRATAIDSREVAQARVMVNSEPVESLDRKALIDFLVDRAEAAAVLGDSVRQRADLRRAMSLAKPGERFGRDLTLSSDSIVSRLMSAEFSGGDIREGTRLAEQLTSPDHTPGWRLAALSTLSQLHRERGNIKGIMDTLGQAESVYRDAMRRNTWRDWRFDSTRQIEAIRGMTALSLGKPEEAELSLRRAIRAAQDFIPLSRAIRARGSRLASAEYYEFALFEGLEIDLVLTLLPQGKLAESEYIARSVLDRRLERLRVVNASTRTPIQRLADVFVVAGRFTEAESLLRQALDIMQKSGYESTSTRMLISRRSLANSLVAQERWAESLSEFSATRAAAALSDLKGGLFGGPSAFEAYALIMTGQLSAAIPALRSLVRWYRDAGRDADVAAIVARGFLAKALMRDGKREEAGVLFEEVMPAFAGDTGALADANLTPFLQLQRRWIIESYLEFVSDTAGKSGQASGDESQVWLALSAVDRLNGLSVQRAIQDAAVRTAASVAGLAPLARKHQDLKNEIDALYAMLGLAIGNQSTMGPDVVLEIRKRLGSATEELTKASTTIDREFPAYRDLLRPKSPTQLTMRAALRPGEVALVVYPGTTSTYVWAIPQQGAIAFHVAPMGRHEVQTQVSNLRRALDPNAFGIHTAIPEFNMQAAHALYESIIRPVEPTIGGARHLLVIAHGALAQVPFGILPTSGAEVRAGADLVFAEYKAMPWLIRRLAITQLPSMASLVTLRGQATGSPNRKSFAGFGDPIFSESQSPIGQLESGPVVRGVRVAMRDYSRAMTLDSSQLAQLPRLPDTADEIRDIARSLNADPQHDVFLGRDANEKEVKTRDLSNRKVIAFATHGLIPGELNGLTQPALALSAPDVAGVEGDGLLTLEEVLGLKLDADWVVLSACNTAAGDGAGADAITGLGRAFLYAGTRALLVSSWPVETVSARLITTGIFARQAVDATLTRAEALRQSILDVLSNRVATDSAGKPAYSYAHPLFWAPFSLIGDGS